MSTILSTENETDRRERFLAIETQLEMAEALIRQDMPEVQRLMKSTLEKMGISADQMDEMAKKILEQLRDGGADFPEFPEFPPPPPPEDEGRVLTPAPISCVAGRGKSCVALAWWWWLAGGSSLTPCPLSRFGRGDFVALAVVVVGERFSLTPCPLSRDGRGDFCGFGGRGVRRAVFPHPLPPLPLRERGVCGFWRSWWWRAAVPHPLPPLPRRERGFCGG